MAINPNEDTEFNEALRKHGILPPREQTPPSPSPPPSPTLDDILDDFTPSELQELGEDAHDDDAERYIAAYRQRVLTEMKKDTNKARFGQLYPIGRDDYTREVTDASKADEPGEEDKKGTGVVCFLYKDGIPRSDRAYEHVRAIAARHPRTKFVSIVGDKCLPNLPDSRVPMFIVYRGGEIRTQIVSWGADRERRVEELEAMFIMCGAIIPPERPPPGSRDIDSEDDEDEESNDRSSQMRSTSTWTNHTTKNVRGPTEKADDSDSDFDL